MAHSAPATALLGQLHSDKSNWEHKSVSPPPDYTGSYTDHQWTEPQEGSVQSSLFTPPPTQRAGLTPMEARLPATTPSPRTMSTNIDEIVTNAKRNKQSDTPLRCQFCSQERDFSNDNDYLVHLKRDHNSQYPRDRTKHKDFRAAAVIEARQHYDVRRNKDMMPSEPVKRKEARSRPLENPTRGNMAAADKNYVPRILSQPETRPISQDQLVAEVKGIYAGLVMIEGKCIQVDLKQAQLAREAAPGTQPVLKNEQYQALIALHRTLLHEHHDFFLASQHPSATPAVRRLAVKYAMPARLWRHGIHSFLELLRNRLPASLEYMLAFIYMAYSMMTLLLETVPSFEDTWIECLGDLGRYRMAIEDDHIHDREIWTQNARQWYLKSANRSPTTGRLYHHLAILARPDPLQQLLFYEKSLSVPLPFPAARESVMTLFEPILFPKVRKARCPPVITAFVKCHAILFTGSSREAYNETLVEYTDQMDGYISQMGKNYLEQGYSMGISNCMTLMSYGAEENVLAKLIKSRMEDKMDSDAELLVPSTSPVFQDALELFKRTAEIHLRQIGNANVLSYVHVTLVFLRYMAQYPETMALIGTVFPWADLCDMLNTVMDELKPSVDVIMGEDIPKPEEIKKTMDYMTLVLPEKPEVNAPAELGPSNDEFRPFPEEWAMRGLFWTESYFPKLWFENPNVEAEKHFMEAESMRLKARPERVGWLGVQLAKTPSPLQFDTTTQRFASSPGPTRHERVVASS